MRTAPSSLGPWNSLRLTIEKPEAGPDTEGYASILDYDTPDGDIVARLAADAIHNHFGVYTRLHPLSNSSGKRVKRLNVQGGTSASDGTPTTEVDLYSPASGDTRLSLGADRNSVLVWDAGKHAVVGGVVGDEWRLVNLTAPKDSPARVLSRIDLNTGQYVQNPPTALRERAAPSPDTLAPRELAWDTTNKRLCYKEDGGDAYCFRGWGKL